MHREKLHPYFGKNGSATVVLMIEGDDVQPFYLGSGVVLRLANKDFVLTAAHNFLENGVRQKVGAGTPSSTITMLIGPGNGTIGRVFLPDTEVGAQPEPDVAVFEPTAKMVLPSGRFGEADVGFFDTALFTEFPDGRTGGRELVVSGYPARAAVLDPMSSVRPGRPSKGSVLLERKDIGVWSIPSFAPKREVFEREPSEGRGIHVHLSFGVTLESGEDIQSTEPKGMSGGPLLYAEGHGTLVGLVRGIIKSDEGWDVWCEPAAEAVRLLIDHDDVEVAAAAARVVARYDAALSV